MSKRIIHGAMPSPFFRKVVAALNELGLDYEVNPLLPLPKTPELLALNPLGKIPIYQEGDLVLPDSSVICQYLDKQQGGSKLYPDDPTQFGQALFLEEYADTALSGAIAGIVYQLFIRKNLLQEEPDMAIVEQHRSEELPPRFEVLEARIDGETLLDTFSIADVAVGTQLQGLGLVGEEIDAARFPKLAAYAEAMLARPSFQKALS